MGMFDEIQFKYPLPEKLSLFQNYTFQTKDTPDQMLIVYQVDLEGRLMRPVYEWTPNVISGIACTTAKVVGWKDTEFHGDIYFSAFERDQDGQTINPINVLNFKMRFTHGIIEWIQQLP